MERVVRGHYAVGFRWVESREKNEEGGAWTLCSGLPLRQCVNHEMHEMMFM